MKAPDLFRGWKNRDTEHPPESRHDLTLFQVEVTETVPPPDADEPGPEIEPEPQAAPEIPPASESQEADEPPPRPDPAQAPLVFALPDTGALRHFKLDYFYRCDTLLVAVGWCTVPGLVPGLATNGVAIRTEAFPMERPDVVKSYALADDEEPLDPDTTGFVLIGRAGPDDPVELTWIAPGMNPERSGTLRPNKLPFNSFAFGVIADRLLDIFTSEPPGSPIWKSLRAAIPPVRGAPPSRARAHFDIACATADEVGGMASGWVLHAPDVHVWLEDDQGHVQTLHGGYRRYRMDVLTAFPDIPATDAHVGFFAHLPEARPGNVLAIWAVSQEGAWPLARMAASPLVSDVKEICKRLATIETPMADLVKRAEFFDVPILSRALALQQAQWDRYDILSVDQGELPDAPLVSIIIPLYGRTDFVEHQLLEFIDDPWLRRNAEVIYVIDDPRLVEPFRSQADELFKIYGMPFRWIWGQVNRGFSGANNLGARVARGDYMLFMNSDVFPAGPGWLQKLVRVLDDEPDIGAVGPRLVFADGGIQHAGMVNRWHEHLGIWINHHPRMGFDPAMDDNTGPVRTPLITGACVLITRATLDRIGGWDTGYVIGDYEDSDLCLALRDAGLAVAYLPEAQLVHLERQSFRLLGEDSFRLRVTLTNAARHQVRWRKYLGADGAAPQQ